MLVFAGSVWHWCSSNATKVLSGPGNPPADGYRVSGPCWWGPGSGPVWEGPWGHHYGPWGHHDGPCGPHDLSELAFSLQPRKPRPRLCHHHGPVSWFVASRALAPSARARPGGGVLGRDGPASSAGSSAGPGWPYF